MQNDGIKLGDEIEDVTAKVRGIAIAHLEYLDGTTAWLMQPPCDPDGEMRSKIEVQSAYAKRVGDGLRVNPQPAMGFRVGNESAG